MPVASCDKEYAPGGHAGSQPARAAERSGQRVARAAGRHGAERRAVLAARRRHADGRRSGTGVRRPQVLYREGRPHARGQRHRAALDQLGHGVRPAVEQAASHGPLVRARLSLRLPPGRSRGPRADPHRRLRGRRALGRAAGLLRPRGRLPPATPAGDDLSRARPGSSGPSGPAPSELILRGGDVLLHDVEWRVERGDVVVRDGRIAAVGWLDPKGSRGAPGAPAGRGRTGRKRAETVVRDCTGCLVMPGLIQAHVHLCQTLFRGLGDDLRLEDWLARRIWPLEAAHTEETVYWSALLGAAELLLGGTTAILDMETVHHTGAAFEALEAIGIRATAGKCLMDAATSPPSLREPTDKALTESADLCARWHGAADGRLRYCFAPRYAPSCTGPLLRAVSDLAERSGATIHTHAAETPLELDTVKRETGHDEIAYLDTVGISGPRAALAHCVWVDKDDITVLARQQTNVVHCPSSNLKLGSGIAPIPEMLAAGCRVGIGADGAPCNNRLDAFAEMRLAALIQKPRLGPDSLPAAQALELATLGGARAVGLEAEIGSIEEGKCADLVALDLSGPHAQPDDADVISRIVYSAQAADVRHVIVDGRIVVRDGVLKTADTAEIRRAANTQARRLRRAVGV